MKIKLKQWSFLSCFFSATTQLAWYLLSIHFLPVPKEQKSSAGFSAAGHYVILHSMKPAPGYYQSLHLQGRRWPQESGWFESQLLCTLWFVVLTSLVEKDQLCSPPHTYSVEYDGKPNQCNSLGRTGKLLFPEFPY